MRTVIVFDSWYGNTEAVARALASAIGGDVQTHKINYATNIVFSDLDLLIVGSPTHGGTGTPAISQFLDSIPPRALAGKYVTTYDTRAGTRWIRFSGYANTRMATALRRKGGAIVSPPSGFYVNGRHGPLRQGELARARQWGRGLKAAVRKLPKAVPQAQFNKTATL